MTVGEFKKDIIKQEIEILQQKVNHFDNLRFRAKQMSITLWLATLGFGLSQNIDWIVLLGIFVPIPFWYLESFYHAYQEGFNGRFWAICIFIRDGRYKVTGEKDVDLATCFSDESFGEFPIPDYYGNKTLEISKRRKNVSQPRNFFKRKMVIFYLPLSVIALIIAVLMFAGIITKS